MKEIAENDYILSANTHSPYNGDEEVSYREPKEILKDVNDHETKLLKLLKEITNQYE